GLAWFSLLLFPGCESRHPQPKRQETRSPTAETDDSSSAKRQETPSQGQQAQEDKIILDVANTIRRRQLTKLADDCLSYNLDSSEKEDYVVSVHENHRDPKCGGDPQTSPRLFSIRVNRKTGAMSTDAGSPAGEHHSLPN